MNPIGNLSWGWFLAYGVWIVVTLVLAGLAYWGLRRWAQKWTAALMLKITPGGADWSRASQTAGRIVLRLSLVVIVAVSVLVILSCLGINMSGVADFLKMVGAAAGRWLATHGVRVGIIVGLAFVASRVMREIVPGIVGKSVLSHRRRAKKDREELKKRSETLEQFILGAATVLVWIFASFMILSELGVDIGPLIAGAGIAGIAIGFGAQNVIRDVLGGFFIIVEDQYRKGDVVKIAGIIGLVELVNIRRTVMRDLDGIVHVVPNGEVTTSSNYSKEWSRVNLNVPVAYGEDLERVIEVINRVGQELFEDTKWRLQIKTAPQVLRVDNFGDSGIDIKVVGDTKPMQQWAVTGELRLRLKRVFDQEGIEIPWPHTKVYLGDKVALDLLARYGGGKPMVPDASVSEVGETIPTVQRRGRPAKRRRRGGPATSGRELPE